MEDWAAIADDIGRGERSVSFPAARGSAELDRLGDTLQSMFIHLREREKSLEAAVAERTGELRRALEEMRLVNDSVASLIARLDLDGRVLYANRHYHEFFGLEPGGAVGRRLGEIAGPRTQQEFDALAPELASGRSVRIDRQATARGATVHLDISLVPHRNAAGAIDSAYVLANDITAHKTVERLLAQQALSDPLTGLANKRHFGDRLAQAIAEAKRDGQRLALLFIDLDDFKPVNDRLGHGAGDSLLKEVASRLLGCVHSSDTVARVGGGRVRGADRGHRRERRGRHRRRQDRRGARGAVPPLRGRGRDLLQHWRGDPSDGRRRRIHAHAPRRPRHVPRQGSRQGTHRALDGAGPDRGAFRAPSNARQLGGGGRQ
jgi:PAS domain S-box-containing protein